MACPISLTRSLKQLWSAWNHRHSPSFLCYWSAFGTPTRPQSRCGWGVPWIDLKNPDSGPLGRPCPETARAVAATLGSHPRRSVALGEFRSLDMEQVYQVAGHFPYAKVGLSGLANVRGLGIAITGIPSASGRAAGRVGSGDLCRLG